MEELDTDVVMTERVAQQRIRYLLRVGHVRPLTERERRILDNLVVMFGSSDDNVASALLNVRAI